MPLEAHQLPDFRALLPEKPGGEINPHFKEAETAFNAWVDKRLDASRATEVYQCDHPRIVALLFPLASYHQLKVIINYFAAGLLMDDLLYGFFHLLSHTSIGPDNLHSDRSTSEDALVLSKLWMKALQAEDDGKAIPHPLIELMRSEMLCNLRAVIGPIIWPQYMVANEKVIVHMALEVQKQEACTTLDKLYIRSYLAYRRWSIGTYLCLPLVRAARSLYIPDDVLENPVVQEMENAIVDITLIVNDVHSFKKEYAFDGAPNNLLSVIQRDPETAHLDFQGRLNYTENLFRAAVERFHACRRELPSFNPEIDRYLDLYADGLIDMAVGNLQWSRANRRYSAFTNDEDRKNNVMRLDLG